MKTKNRIYIASFTFLVILYMTRESTIKPIATIAAQYLGTRGLRNNNPGNIRWDGSSQWQGMIGQDDKNFVIFDTPENGIRALVRVLRNYQKRGVDTIAEIISTWAPPSENNTAAYIAHVADVVGLPADAKVGYDKFPLLVDAIIAHENFVNPYPDSVITAGVAAGFA